MEILLRGDGIWEILIRGDAIWEVLKRRDATLEVVNVEMRAWRNMELATWRF